MHHHRAGGGNRTRASILEGSHATTTPHPRCHSLFVRPYAVTVRTNDIALTRDRKSTRLNSSHLVISYAVFCLKKKKQEHASTPRPRATCVDRPPRAGLRRPRPASWDRTRASHGGGHTA